jgi:cytochrome P450
MTRRAPGPFAPPLVGGALNMRDPLHRLPALRARYGGLVRLGPIGGAPLYLVADPELVKHVLIDNQKNYKKGRAAQRMRPILGDGLLLLEGEPWRRHRRLVQPSFHKKKVADLGAAFVAAADGAIERIGPRIARGEAFDAREEMIELAMGLTIRNLFKTEPGELRGLIDAWGDLYTELSARRFSLLDRFRPSARRARARLETALRTVHGALDAIVRDRRANPRDDGSLVAMLLASQDEETGATLADRELRDELMTLFVGGYETTSNALGFSLALLAKHPDIAARHRAELDRVLGRSTPGMEHLAQLPLNRAIIDEAMRLFPPSWVITREALGPDVVGGYDIEANAQLLLSCYVIHHDPNVWPDPDRFDPDRFLSESAKTRHRFAHFPFGGGPRLCVGDQYALTEAQLIVARFAQMLDLRVVPGSEIAAQAGVGLRPLHPLRIKASRRSSTQTISASAP